MCIANLIKKQHYFYPLHAFFLKTKQKLSNTSPLLLYNLDTRNYLKFPECIRFVFFSYLSTFLILLLLPIFAPSDSSFKAHIDCYVLQDSFLLSLSHGNGNASATSQHPHFLYYSSPHPGSFAMDWLPAYSLQNYASEGQTRPFIPDAYYQSQDLTQLVY